MSVQPFSQIQNQPSKPRVVLSSIEQVSNLLRAKPELLNIPAFSGLRPLIEYLKNNGKGCGCTIKELYARYLPNFSAAINSLKSSDIEIMKNVLNASQICYYTRSKVNGALERICL